MAGQERQAQDNGAMRLVGVRGQTDRDTQFSVSGTITSPTKALVLPEHRSRSMLLFTNLSSATMYLEIGAGEATATVSGGAVTSIAVVNGGFNYTIAPQVTLLGGGNEGNTSFLGATAPGYQPPGSPGAGVQPLAWNPAGSAASAHAVISGGVVTSIVVDNSGSGYVIAPWVLLQNDTRDPNGVADPSINSGSGIPLVGGATYYVNGTSCPTSPVAVYCSTSGSRWCCKFMM